MIDCLVWIVDETSAMEGPGRDLRPSLSAATSSFVNDFLRGTELPLTMQLAIVGYREGDAAGTLDVGCRGVATGQKLIPLAEWIKNKLEYKPLTRGKASCEPAFALVSSLLDHASHSRQEIGRLAVVHVTSSTPSQLPPGHDAMQHLLRIPTRSGSPLLFHVDLLRGLVGKPVDWYCTPSGVPDTPFRKWLFETASVLPADWPKSAQGPASPDARGIIVRARKSDVDQFLAVLSQVIRSWGDADVSSQPAIKRPIETASGLAPTSDFVPPSVVQSARTSQRVRWLYAPDRRLVEDVYGRPIVTSQEHVVVSSGASLISLNRKTGLEIWKRETPHGEKIASAPTRGEDGAIRVHDVDGTVMCVDENGRVKWTADVGSPNRYSTPVVDVNGDTYVTVSTGGVWKIDSHGYARPFYATEGQFENLPVTLNSTGLIAGDRLFLGGDDHCLHAIRLKRDPDHGDIGQPAWDAWGRGEGRTNGYVNPAVARSPNGEFVVASSDDHLWAFNDSGGVAWKIPLGGLVLASPVIDPQGMLYVGVNRQRGDGQRQGQLVHVDPRRRPERQIVWAVELRAPIESTPAIGDDGMVYAADRDGNVYAIRPQGDVEWVESLETSIRSAVALVGDNRLVVTTQDGRVVALECSSRSSALAGWPQFVPAKQ